MAVTEIDIANMALSHLSHGQPIADFDEGSQEADALRMWKDEAREQFLRESRLPATTRYAALELLSETTVAGWAYTYRYPADCLDFRRILSGLRRDASDTKVPFKISAGTSSMVIYTDQPEAEGEYTKNITDPELLHADAREAWSLKLAALAAPLIVGGDTAQIVEKMEAKYARKVLLIRAKALNEKGVDNIPKTASIRARGG